VNRSAILEPQVSMVDLLIDSSLYHEPPKMAELAELLYVSDEQPGFQRQRRGKGFVYRDEQGARLSEQEALARIKALVIPPAWTHVWICADPNGHIQATGRDEQGRKQYIYHTRWGEVRNLAKFGRLLQFGQALPAIRRQVAIDLKAPCMSREKVVAIAVRLLEDTHIRIGNPEYAQQHQSYGLTTLRKRHLRVTDKAILLKFKGKSGKVHEIAIEDKKLIRLIKKCQELPGQTLFQYLDDDGMRRTLQSGDVNDYLKQITGESFTAKDFRTWGGTVTALSALYQLGPASTEKEQKKNITKAIQQTAQTLGNTPTVCRQYYVHPQILSAYVDNTLFVAVQQAAEQTDEIEDELDLEEVAVLKLLENQESKR